MSFSGEALVGYNYSMNDFSITPMGGLRLTGVNDDGYTETGTTNQNLSIARKALNKAELVVGARVGGPAYDLNGVSVTPEVHGFLNQDMIGKNAKVNIKTSNGTNVVDKSSKPNKTSFNVGAGLDAKYSYMEYGIAYDANISKKFMSNQGTIKVRLNF
jgi:outer membrane autotransporter protein